MAGNRSGRKSGLIEGSWKGRAGFLIGGGPSLKHFYWARLWGHHEIVVVNAALMQCPKAAFFFTEDIRFIERFHTEPWYRTADAEKVFHALAPEYEEQALAFDPELTIIRKCGGAWEESYKFWSKSFKDGLSYSSNSAIGALNVLDLLGADPIYLLGIDCNPRDEASNYHELYPDQWRARGHQLESFRSDFEHWAAPNLKHRNVVNLNPSSGVRCWPRRSWAEEFGSCQVGDL